jgi:hypothetical protein
MQVPEWGESPTVNKTLVYLRSHSYGTWTTVYTRGQIQSHPYQVIDSMVDASTGRHPRKMHLDICKAVESDVHCGLTLLQATTRAAFIAYTCTVIKLAGPVISQILASPTLSFQTNSGAFWSRMQLRDFGVGLCFYFSSLHLFLLPIS